MQITNVEIKNFRGIKELSCPTGRLNAVMGGNGAGKTSFLGAVIFCLTGKLKETDIRKGESGTSVTLTFADGTTIHRSKSEEKSVVKVNGRTMKKKAAAKYLERYAGADTETLLACLTTDYFRECSAKDLTNLFLSLMPVTLTFEQMCDLAHIDDEDAELLAAYFPPEPEAFELEEIAKVHKKLREKRTEVNGEIKALSGLSSGSELPEETEEALKKRLEQIQKMELDLEQTMAKRKEYERQVGERERILKEKEDLEKTIRELGEVQEPDQKMQEKAATERQQFIDAIERGRETITLCERNIEIFSKTISDLSSGYCPIHASIRCTTDKTDLKEELEKALKENEELKSKKTTFLERCRDQIKMRDEELKAYNDNLLKYQKADILKGQLEVMTVPEIPEEVPVPKDSNQSAEEKKTITEKLLIWERSRMEEKNLELLKEKEKEKENLERMLSLTDEKGIRTILLDRATSVMEEECNRFAEENDLGLRFIISCDDIIKVVIKNEANGKFVPLNELSGGEYIMSCLVLSRIFCTTLNLNVFIADDIDRLDNNNIEKLLQSLEQDQKYETIFLSGISHKETLVAIKEHTDNILFLE